MVLDQPVVILGGGGFIGSRLGQELEASGYEVTLVDIEFHPWRWGHPSQQVRLDLRTFSAAAEACDLGETIFHLAADMGGVEYFHGDADFGASIDNQLITTNVLRAIAPDQKLIYASSACAANTFPQKAWHRAFRIREQDILEGEPDARYGAEKRHGAYMVANAPCDGRVAVLHTVYGPGQEFQGIRRKFPSAVCTNALALEPGQNLTLFGDGSQTRSYLYIDDAVERLLTLAEAPVSLIEKDYWTNYPAMPDWLNRVYNIGSQTPVTCNQVAEFVLGYLGSDADIEYNRDKPTGVQGRSCDLGHWQFKFGDPYETPLSEGFPKFIEWLKLNV